MFWCAPARWRRRAAAWFTWRSASPISPRPAHIVEAAKKALDEGWTHYGPTQGQPELREAIAAHISRTRGIPVGPEHVSVVPGGKPIIFFPMLALLEPGDEVIYPNPGFPIYESMIRFLGATPVPMPLEESRGFSFDLDRVPRPPHRPDQDGDPQFAAESHRRRDSAARTSKPIADLLRDRDVMVLSDEIYSRIYYDEPPVSIAQFPGMLEKTIILDGFSKTYAMTGWRMGYGVMPDMAGGRGEQADGEFELLHRQLHPARRHRRPDRAAGLRRRDGRRVPPPPRRRSAPA